MKFFSKELCKQLDDLGLVCKTQFAYYHNWPSPIYDIALYPKSHEQILVCNAFSIYDFLSDEEYAEENCAKIHSKILGHKVNWADWRRLLLNSKNQEAYIKQAVEKLNE